MRDTTWRQYLLSLACEREERNYPDRTDHYLMQIAWCVLQSRSKRKISMDDMKLKWVPKKQEQQEPAVTVEEATRRSKALWAARLGIQDWEKLDAR